MNCLSRRAAAVVLAIVLSIPSIAVASPVQVNLGRKVDLVARAIRQIQKLFGVTINGDTLTPPKPAPAPPPPPAE